MKLTITSKDNTQIKYLRKLISSSKFRKEEEKFVIEGSRICDEALKNNTSYDTWQEGFESLLEMLKQDKVFVLNVYHHVSNEYTEHYLYKVTYNLLYRVVEEKSKGMIIKEEDKVFIANFYKYGFVGLVCEWIKKDMADEPKLIVSRLNSLIQGSFAQALNNARLDH